MYGSYKNPCSSCGRAEGGTHCYYCPAKSDACRRCTIEYCDWKLIDNELYCEDCADAYPDEETKSSEVSQKD